MVGARCAVASCNNSYTTAKKRGHVLSLHCFPKDQDLKEFWIQACSRGDAWNPDTSFVCSDHFALEDFISDQRLQLWTGVKWRPQLKPGAVPTRNLPETKHSRYKMGQSQPREPRRRFSMFQVLSIELESRQEKMNRFLREDVTDTPGRGDELNAGNTGCSGDPQNDSAHERGSTCQTVDRISSNRVTTSPVLLSNSDDERTTEGSSRVGYTDSGTENGDLMTACSSHLLEKSQTHKLKVTSRNRDNTDRKHSTAVRKNVDFSAEESQLPSVIYSCPAFELFVDDEK